MMQKLSTVIFLCGKHEVCHRMIQNQSLNQGEEIQQSDQCGELIKKLDSYKAGIRFLSDDNVDQNLQFSQSPKLLKTELEFEEQKLRMLT